MDKATEEGLTKDFPDQVWLVQRHGPPRLVTDRAEMRQQLNTGHIVVEYSRGERVESVIHG